MRVCHNKPFRLQTMAAIALIAALMATSAGAQTRPAPTGLAITASGEVLYDSNSLRLSTGRSPRGHVDDIRYSPALTAAYARNVGPVAVNASGTIGRDYFQYNSHLNRNRISAGGSLQYRLGARCSLGVNGSYTSRQNGIGSAAIDGAVPIDIPPDDVGQVVDNRQESSSYGVNANCGSPSGRLTFGGGYTHSELNNKSPTRQFADSVSDVYNGNIGIGILRPGQLSINGSYSTIDYPNRRSFLSPVPIELLNAGVKTYRLGVTFTRPIGTRLSGTIGASYLHAAPSGPQGGYSSPAYNLGLTYNSGNRLTVGLTGSRNIIASTTAGALYRVVDQLGINSTYKLGHSLALDANAGFIINNYKQSFGIAGEPARRLDRSTTLSAGLTYSPRRLYDVRLFVSQTIRTSEPAVFDYNSTKVGATLAVHL